MAEGTFYIVAKEERDVSKRYLVRVQEGVYVFGSKTKASIHLGRNRWMGNKTQEESERLVDQLREDAAAGKVPPAWATAQAETASGHVIYKGQTKAAPALPQEFVNPNVECWDTVYRVAPTAEFRKVQRGFVYAYAFVDAAGTPRAGTVEGATHTELIKKIFDPVFPVFKELVLRFPLSNPADLVEREPVPEKVISQQEIDAVEPLTDREFDSPEGGASVQSAKYNSDPLYRSAYDKRETSRKAFHDAIAKKQKAEDDVKAAELAKAKLKLKAEMEQI